MPDIQHLIGLLKSDNPNKRYDACEQLRVSPVPLTEEAIDALRSATNDIDPDVADAAQRALVLHVPPLTPDILTEKKQEQPSETILNETRSAPKRKANVLWIGLAIVLLVVLWGLWESSKVWVIFTASDMEAQDFTLYPSSFEGYWTPSRQDVLDLEGKLEPFIQANAQYFHHPPIDLSNYKRQYFGEMLGGSRIITGHFFCTRGEYNWKKVLILFQFFDGGDCFFSLQYNVDEGMFIDGVEVNTEP